MGEDSKETKNPFTLYINGKPYPSDGSQPLNAEEVSKVLETINNNINAVMGTISENLNKLPLIGGFLKNQNYLPHIESSVEKGHFIVTANGQPLLDIDLSEIKHHSDGVVGNRE